MTPHPSIAPHRFVKKPTTVEAMQFDGSGTSQAAIVKWAGDAIVPTWDGEEFGVTVSNRHLKVETLHGITEARAGDWIVKGPAGDFWPVHRDLFHDLYAPLEPNPGMTVIS